MIKKLAAFILIILNSTFANSHKICDKKAVFCGVVKNCARFFDENKKEIERLASLFKDYAVVIYENNSSDLTKVLYSNWSTGNEKVIFISEDLSEIDLKNYTPLIADFRTEVIARARNKTLDIATSNKFKDYDYVIMMDLDDFEPINIDEFIKTIENPLKEWDAVYANGSYDLYSLKSIDFPCGPELTTWDYLNKELFSTGKRLSKLLKIYDWYPVDSFFGGFGIFKREAVKNNRYSGKINTALLNQVIKYNESINILSLPQYQECKDQISKNFQKYINYFTKNEFPPDGEIYTCEHIIFNLGLKNKGFNKIYINSKLTRPSKSRWNF